MKNFELSGIKGFFSTDTAKIFNNSSSPGVLSIEDKSIKLELMGSMLDKENQTNNEYIYGATLDGKLIILLRWHELNVFNYYPDMNQQYTLRNHALFLKRLIHF